MRRQFIAACSARPARRPRSVVEQHAHRRQRLAGFSCARRQTLFKQALCLAQVFPSSRKTRAPHAGNPVAPASPAASVRRARASARPAAWTTPRARIFDIGQRCRRLRCSGLAGHCFQQLAPLFDASAGLRGRRGELRGNCCHWLCASAELVNMLRTCHPHPAHCRPSPGIMPGICAKAAHGPYRPRCARTPVLAGDHADCQTARTDRHSRHAGKPGTAAGVPGAGKRTSSRGRHASRVPNPDTACHWPYSWAFSCCDRTAHSMP